MDNIERMMKQDIKAMKRIGRNVKYQKGKRGLGTGNFNPLRGMTQKQIAKLHGETKVYDMSKILHKTEFNKLDNTMKKLYLESWRARFSTEEILQGMGVSSATYYKYCKKYGATGEGAVRKKFTRKKKEQGDESVATIIDLQSGEEIVEPVQETVQETLFVGTTQEMTIHVEQPTPQKKVSALLTLDETVSGEKLATRLRAIAELVNDNEMYTINMTLER